MDREALSASLSAVDSYYGVWRWQADNREAIAALPFADRDALDWERIERQIMLADRLAERAAA